jgi:hypothetical protein
MVQGASGEHLLVDRTSGALRLDVVQGTTLAGPVKLLFELVDDDCLEVRLSAIRAFRSKTAVNHRHRRLANRLLALQAFDARKAGLSLRDVAALVLGPGDWPGDGEYRKSLVRRLLVIGEKVISDGPRAILSPNQASKTVAAIGTQDLRACEGNSRIRRT